MAAMIWTMMALLSWLLLTHTAGLPMNLAPWNAIRRIEKMVVMESAQISDNLT